MISTQGRRDCTVTRLSGSGLWVFAIYPRSSVMFTRWTMYKVELPISSVNVSFEFLNRRMDHPSRRWSSSLKEFSFVPRFLRASLKPECQTSNPGCRRFYKAHEVIGKWFECQLFYANFCLQVLSLLFCAGLALAQHNQYQVTTPVPILKQINKWVPFYCRVVLLCSPFNCACRHSAPTLEIINRSVRALFLLSSIVKR